MFKLLSAITIASLVSMTTPIGVSAHVLEKKFSNCKELNKIYPGGVSKSSSTVNSGGATKYAPTVNAKVYLENKTKDRDGDGIACER